MKKILQVKVGSHAHGLADAGSDVDYRGVFVQDTRALLKLYPDKKDTIWSEGEKDTTLYEISKFLLMSVKGVPTILEVFLSPVYCQDGYGKELRSLFPHVWNSKNVRDSFINYSKNQRKKFLEDKGGRGEKYAINYLRSLYNGYELLSSGKTFSVNLKGTAIFEKLLNIRDGKFSPGEIINEGFFWEKKLEDAYQKRQAKITDMEIIENFLFKVRKAFW